MTEVITFSPKDFIEPPFIECPKCSKESFGILMICDSFYLRRCKECFYPYGAEPRAKYQLPELNKKVVYVDQFAISNMMKILNPQTKAYKQGKLDKFWMKLFEKLDSLCKLQLIVCPSSHLHTKESLLSGYYESMKRMYELLSGGVKFYDLEAIRRSQICEHVANWIAGNSQKEIKIDVHSIVHSKINAWQERLIMSLNIKYQPDWIRDIKRKREKVREQLTEVFKKWQNEKHKNFKDWFNEEYMGFGDAILRVFKHRVMRAFEISSGISEQTEDDIFPPPAVILVTCIQDVFSKAGVAEPDLLKKTIEYLRSPALRSVPFLRISSMLWAAVARKAAHGKKKPPNEGLDSDISVISVLLPYCDAMFIDNEFCTYLKERPLCDEINYGTKVFSQNTKDEFLNYLDSIEKSATKEHLDKVDEVYGKDWKKPFTTLYKATEN